MATYRQHSAGPMQFYVEVHNPDGSRETVRVRTYTNDDGLPRFEEIGGEGRLFQRRVGGGIGVELAPEDEQPEVDA